MTMFYRVHFLSGHSTGVDAHLDKTSLHNIRLVQRVSLKAILTDKLRSRENLFRTSAWCLKTGTFIPDGVCNAPHTIKINKEVWGSAASSPVRPGEARPPNALCSFQSVKVLISDNVGLLFLQLQQLFPRPSSMNYFWCRPTGIPFLFLLHPTKEV